ncbi:MAG: 3-deoxy-manno-octulosonate cytidylyltransferase [Elusimicrobia bacterium]|nr:3-deoxy-manno-octulosonate cytidylyltransferase [Elusimicrobiota bacterium]
MKTTAFVQARLGSTRLPGKILMDIEGQPLIWHVLERVRAASSIDDIVVATTSNHSDAPLVAYLNQIGVLVTQGSENDVLDRFYQAALKHRTDIVVRITPDDPFKDPAVIDQAVALLKSGQPHLDYVSNCSYDGSIKSTFPEGIDIEVMTFNCLERLWKNAKRSSEREHVTPYLFNHGSEFKKQGFYHPVDLSKHRWTIDYENDMAFTREIYRRLYKKKKIFLMQDILDVLSLEPQLALINSGTIRYEGYHKSVKAEQPC